MEGPPIAAIVGRRWGRVRWVNGRSVEGTLAVGFEGLLMLVSYGLDVDPEQAFRAADREFRAAVSVLARHGEGDWLKSILGNPLILATAGGVVAIIAPWNYPLTQIKRQLGANGIIFYDREIYTETFNIAAQQAVEYIKAA